MDDFEHKYTRRSRSHDYYAPATYHIILKKREECEPFGSVAGDPRCRPGSPGCARIDRSPLGKIIHREVYELQRRYPKLQIYQYMVMPDHVHILLRVKVRITTHPGHYIKSLKDTVNAKWCLFSGIPSDVPVVFKGNYTDRIIYNDRDLDMIFRYIRENPHRLAVRKMCPEFFRRMRRLWIEYREWEAYGNVFLLRNPFKEQVVVHRKDSEADFDCNMGACLENVEDGGVSVSPFISPREKRIRSAVEEKGGRVILITNEPFGTRYKPAEHDFRLCEEGRLLIIAPVEPFGIELDRATCLKMNGAAKAICDEKFEIR
ncbi:MAG: transposase [Muribaculaceae bacterium]|nr:transposase [Muribaculaceae bacterium]